MFIIHVVVRNTHSFFRTVIENFILFLPLWQFKLKALIPEQAVAHDIGLMTSDI